MRLNFGADTEDNGTCRWSAVAAHTKVQSIGEDVDCRCRSGLNSSRRCMLGPDSNGTRLSDNETLVLRMCLCRLGF